MCPGHATEHRVEASHVDWPDEVSSHSCRFEQFRMARAGNRESDSL